MLKMKLFLCTVALDYYQAMEKIGVKIRAHGHDGASKYQGKVDACVRDIKKR